ncbi:hypothetical protein [Methylogaea oryzae]|uniref:Uncharacterized protein n=1 Tax=Methylogaea oryzae TaxID=1295382 RepID=A0A8D4VPZ1_9GAMM|nr:hypothetical protein [Methylogaea oryzae]BBL70315.1 hypothetical protein MoryE10_09210 [Methylogaea oryzae]
MNGLMPFLRLLMVPLSISLVGALLVSVWANSDMLDWSEVANMSRMLFVWHAIWAMVLTLIVGMPFIRYHTNRQTMGGKNWLIAWALVFALPALLQNWLLLPVAVGLAWLWWKLYYGREQQSAATP